MINKQCLTTKITFIFLNIVTLVNIYYLVNIKQYICVQSKKAINGKSNKY